jgi:hypothetical protein
MNAQIECIHLVTKCDRDDTIKSKSEEQIYCQVNGYISYKILIGLFNPWMEWMDCALWL